jgi:alkylation response protein AidB-like acyl-CoA dehydrogenase
MDFEFNDMQQMLIDSAARLIKDCSGIEYWRGRRNLPDGCDQAMWNQFAELGWLALAVPEDAGGLGGTMEDIALLMAELGRGLVTDPIASTAVLAAHVIDRLAGADLREALLAAIASGESRIALAHEEVGDRYELTCARVTVALRKGEDYVLNGAKLMALDAPSAQHLLVTAGIADEEGYGIFLVAADAPGLTFNSYPLVDGSRAADLDLIDVAVAADRLLGSGGAALAALQGAVDRATVALMAQAVGAMEAAVVVVADYAKERKQFGQPIGKFQAIQHLAADMFVAAYQARSALYQLLAQIDDPSATERARAVSIARCMIAEAGTTVGHNGIQIHGGYGVTDEYTISHYHRRLFALSRQYGDADYHLARLAALGSAETYES